MAAPGSDVLARQYIELLATGNVDQELEKIRNQLQAADRALSGAGTGFRTFFIEKTGLARKLMQAQQEMARVEAGLYDTGPYRRYVQAHVQLSAQLQATQGKAAVAGKQAQVQYQGTEEGKKALRLQVEMEGQLKRLGATDAWQKMVAEQGKVGASLSILTEQLKGFQGVAGTAFATATGAITAFSAAASPEIFGTLTGSLQLVAGELGMAFIPYLVEASRFLQNLADDIRNMDPATKDQIASWILWGGAIAGTLLFLPRVLSIGGALLGVLGMLNRAVVGLAVSQTASTSASAGMIAGMSSVGGGAAAATVPVLAFGGAVRTATAAMVAFFAANPATVILGLVAAVAALSGAFSIVGDGIQSAASDLERFEEMRDRLAQGGTATRQDVRTLLTHEERELLGRHEQGSAPWRAELERIQRESGNVAGQAEERSRLAERVGSALPGMGGLSSEERRNRLTNQLGMSGSEAQHLHTTGALQGREMTPQQIASVVANIRSDAPNAAAREAVAAQALRTGQLNLGAREVVLRRPPVEPGSGSIAGAQARLQQAAFRDPLQMEQLAQNVRAYELGVQQLQATRDNTAAQREANQQANQQPDSSWEAGAGGDW